MRESVLDLSNVDLDDQDAVEAAWNRWVLDLYAEGLRPVEHPRPESTETRLVYQLIPVGSLNDFSSTVNEGVLNVARVA